MLKIIRNENRSGGSLLLWFAMTIVLVMTQTLSAQGVITGRVTDSDTGDPLADVNVFIGVLGIGASSTADGNYSIDRVPEGRHEVTGGYIGYETSSQMVDVSSGATVNIDFALEITIQRMPSIFGT